MVVTILFVLIMLSQSLLSLYGDLLLAKTKLKSERRFIAEIIYFATIDVSREGPMPLTVVSYLNDGEVKKAVFYKDKRDKVGKRIEIVANDVIAVRNAIFISRDLKIIPIILSSIAMIWVGPFLYELFDMIIVIILGMVFFLLTIISISSICFREMFDDELKSALHWE